MRIILSIFFLITSLTCFSQSRKDTIENLFKLSEEYYVKMYVNKDFDSASKMWNAKTIRRLKEIYKTENSALSDSLVIAKTKLALHKYFPTVEIFSFSMFGFNYANNNLQPLEIQLSFYYKIVDDKKVKKRPTALFFMQETKNNIWKLEDLIVLEVAKKDAKGQ